MRLCGIDPASKTGLVVVDEKGRLVARATFNPSPTLSLDLRLDEMYGDVDLFLLEWRPDFVGIEVLRSYLARNATVKTFGIQAQFVGAVRAAIGRYGKPVYEQAPPCVRGKTVTGLATGEVARAILRGAWGAIADDLTEHECDAAMIARKLVDGPRRGRL